MSVGFDEGEVKLPLELPLAAVCVSERQFWLSPLTNFK